MMHCVTDYTHVHTCTCAEVYCFLVSDMCGSEHFWLCVFSIRKRRNVFSVFVTTHITLLLISGYVSVDLC